MRRASVFAGLMLFAGCSLLVDPRAHNEYDLRDAGRRDGGTQGNPDAQVRDAGPDAAATIPAAPVLRFPWNGYMTGSVHTGALPPERDALRPRFVWEPSEGADDYEIQLTSACDAQARATCRFDGALTATTDATEWRPDEPLPVSTSPPVGRRYVWRVRACNAAGCSAWSEVRYLDVGRQPSDFNGDGYADLLVGAYAEQSGAGNVYVFAEGTTSEPSRELAGWIGTGTTPALLGWMVAAVGDVNADGFPDAVVTALLEPSGGVPTAGRAYLLAGTAGPVGLDLARPVVLESPHPDDTGLFGFAVGGAGDLDGDGFADFAIGAPEENVDGVMLAGRAYVYRGGPAIASVPAPIELTSSVPEPGGSFGASVSVAGDTDGDGLVDLVVGAAGEAGSGTRGSGRVYVFTTYRDGSFAEPDILLSRAPAEWGGFGASVATRGDLDGDGYADLVVGAPFEGSGRAYVFRGSASGVDHVTTLTSSDAAPEAGFGARVTTSGDLDGDGLYDLAIGALHDAYGLARSGAVYVMLGMRDLASGPPLTRLVSPAAERDGWFGVSVALATDMDVDGRAELACGAFETVAGHPWAGRVYFFEHKSSFVQRGPALSAPAPIENATFGAVVVDTTVTGSGFDPI